MNSLASVSQAGNISGERQVVYTVTGHRMRTRDGEEQAESRG